MARRVKINFSILNEYTEDRCGGKELFLGCWSPDPITLSNDDALKNLQLNTGKNWFAIRNGADHTNGVIFPKKKENDPEVVIFRGYELDDSIHSYSKPEQVINHWRDNLDRRHNGIFSAVTISENGSELNLITDILGIGPLFYREINGLIFFASSPGVLSMAEDKPNKISWMMRFIHGYVLGNETLSHNVEKLVPASVTTFTRNNMAIKRWYNHRDFPQGEKVLDDNGLKLSEEKFSQAIKRCQKIEFGKNILPLTSGYDSRRILAHLMDKKTKFKSYTVQMPEPTGEDVDMTYATIIANDYNLDHTNLKMPEADEWYNNERQKLYSLDALCSEHTWSVSFFNHFDQKHVCFYDGIGGDILMFSSWDLDTSTIDLLPTRLPSCLNVNNMPSLRLIEWNFRKHYMPPTYGVNQAIITCIMWLTRNRTSIWAQQQLKPGQLNLCPYFDIDFLELSFNYMQDEYEKKCPQELIMEKFWPKLRAYPSSRDLEEGIFNRPPPENTPDIGEKRRKMKLQSLKQILSDSYIQNNSNFKYNSLLNRPARWVLFCAQFSNFLAEKITWWLIPASEMMLWWQTRPFIIEIEEDE